MTTRSSDHWTTQPGNWDTTKSSIPFPGHNPYNIPDLKAAPLSAIPQWLAPYRTRIRTDSSTDDGAIHFFLDDYRFETVWNSSGKALRYLSNFKTLLTPDFSLYADMPLAVQLWNTYRNRWTGAYWQSLGFTVIPTISWSDERSFNFAFLGAPKRSLVAISSLVTEGKLDYPRFVAGFEAMVRVLQPSAVLCYGRLNPELQKLAAVHIYPTTWENIRRSRNHGYIR